jgi:hypothetical protein
MIIDAISDMHGAFPNLLGGDLLIIAGDCTSNDSLPAWHDFFDWLDKQQYNKKILVAGNHDNFCKQWATAGTFTADEYYQLYPDENPTIDYLCDSGTEFEGLKIWGTPWSLWFHGINPHCKAYTCTEIELRKHLLSIPRDIDILISHGPPYGIFDKVLEYQSGRIRNCGSTTLSNLVLDGSHFSNLKAIIFGHIHEHGGKKLQTTLTTFYNVSIMDENYDPTHAPTRIIL